MANGKCLLLILVLIASFASIIVALLYSQTLYQYDSTWLYHTPHHYTQDINSDSQSVKSTPIKSEPLQLHCPQRYEQCSTNLEDILQYTKSKNNVHTNCIQKPLQNKTRLFTHIQGDWLNISDAKSAYLNVTHSKSFILHRLYYSNYSLPSHPKYIPLMNSNDACDLGSWGDILDINGINTMNHKNLHQYQCNLHLQNRSISNVIVSYKKYSKWYPDNDNFIDIITATNTHMEITDLFNQCNNEVYTPRECCGQHTPIRWDRAPNNWKKWKANGQKNISIGHSLVINVAQSRGYYHV